MTRRLSRLAALLVCVLLGTPAAAAQLAFGAFGDVPYNRDEEPQLAGMIAEMNREKLAFAIHVGDFKASQSECSDALFEQRRDTFALSHHPFFYTPGDNEWVDCRRARWAPHDPLERLDKMRELFFARDASLGQRPLAAQRQATRGYPENLRWLVDGIVFATINVPGPNNHQAIPAESTRRTAAVLDWISEAFAAARERKAPALVIATQANLFTGSSGYASIVKALSTQAQRYAGEVLVVHGDTHLFKFDKPLVDPDSGRAVQNVSRLEVHGSPFVNWSYVTLTVERGKASFAVVPGGDVAAKRSR